VGSEIQELLMVEPPRGMYSSRLDDKGRAKMPVTFQQFFAALREKKLFVTSLDRRVAQIYPMAVWRQNERFFDNYRDDPRLARNVAFNAADLGAEAEMDAQGRFCFRRSCGANWELRTRRCVCSHIAAGSKC